MAPSEFLNNKYLYVLDASYKGGHIGNLDTWASEALSRRTAPPTNSRGGEGLLHCTQAALLIGSRGVLPHAVRNEKRRIYCQARQSHSLTIPFSLSALSTLSTGCRNCLRDPLAPSLLFPQATQRIWPFPLARPRGQCMHQILLRFEFLRLNR
jgi:hypothetical protein